MKYIIVLDIRNLMEWFYNGLEGIRLAESTIASEEIVIRPEPVGDFTFAKVSYKSPYGIVRSEWKNGKISFELVVKIPSNTLVTFYLPSKNTFVIFESGINIKTVGSCRIIGYEKGKTIVSVGSGIYKFSFTN